MRREETVNLTRAPRLTRPRLVILAAVLAIAGLFTAISQIAPAQAAGGHDTRAGAATGRTKPTIVLEHGAFADASSWSGVIQLLQDDGYTVYAHPTRCAALPTTARPWPTSSPPFTDPSSWPGIPTAA